MDRGDSSGIPVVDVCAAADLTVFAQYLAHQF